jgi:hypothetical protein
VPSHIKDEEARIVGTEPRGVLMRVAVLADIHGNLPALDAVLHDIDAVQSMP